VGFLISKGHKCVELYELTYFFTKSELVHMAGLRLATSVDLAGVCSFRGLDPLYCAKVTAYDTEPGYTVKCEARFASELCEAS